MNTMGQFMKWGFVAGALVLVAGCGAGSGRAETVLTPSQLISASASNTLSQRTADVTISGSISADGQTIPISGSGQMDLTTQSLLMSMSMTASSQPLTMTEMMTSGRIYMDFVIDGTDAARATGYKWIAFPISVPSKGSGSSDLFGSDPLAQLKLMEGQGATVRSLGTKTLDGRQVAGYAVTPSRAEVEAGAKEIDISGLPASDQSAINSAVSSGPIPVQDVWIDSSKLVRQLDVTVQAGASTASADVAMDFTKYGVSIPYISAPAPNQVISFANFLKYAEEQANSAS